MATILYLNNHYINSLDDLQQVIVRSIKEDDTSLYKEVETLFKDNVIQNWLAEGDIDCHKVYSSLISIPNNIDSSKLKEKIGNVFSDELIKVNRKYNDFIELTQSSFSLNGTDYETIQNDFEASTENSVTGSLKFQFKVHKQESESFGVSLLLDNVAVGGNQTLDIRLYRDGESAEVEFKNIVIRQGVKNAVFTLKIDDEAIKTIKFSGEYEKMFDVEDKDGHKVEFNMIKIKGGSFNMSQDYHVELSDYYIGQFLVTQELWSAVMNSNPSKFVDFKNPVERVSWDDICKQHGFIYKLNRQLKDKIPDGWEFALPTEAQWEFAARGGRKSKNNKYAGTTMKTLLPFYCWFDENSQGKTHPVGTRKPNELDLYDMCGNVWEWCSDLCGDYPKGNHKNPTGPKTGDRRVEKGGSYYHDSNECYITSRKSWESNQSDDLLGFRLCLVKV